VTPIHSLGNITIRKRRRRRRRQSRSEKGRRERNELRHFFTGEK
jgi:hypothetical protein